MWSSLPTSGRFGAIAGLGAALASGMYLLTYFVPTSYMRWLTFGMLAVGFVMALFIYFVHQRRESKAKPMEQGLRQHGAGAPAGVSEVASRARMDGLRKQFDEGLEKFRAAGKNIYSLPWYALVGEPGSGKTEAVRHCNVGFPPGLQDQLQGVGGTINMNWWFTNHAVILDTAGRLMFEEVEAGSTSEWREFLKLLRANRPNCPINGMLLCIPADSLIRDTADQLERKGAKIAQQLDQIQRALGVRFPVFVIITKADLILGFREFFDDLTDPQLQHQILGWSNPAPLDQPFSPDLVREHLETVVQRLKRRRLGLMLDPVNTEDPNARRADQVDAMYAFPTSIGSIAPRLQRYLEMIFVAGEWSAKPLFLRGIYFASSMREGSALDAELAEVLGVPVESLPEGKVWERERAYFLRDLFMQKVFREKGLVTNASNAKKQVRRRKATVLAAGFLSVLLVAAFTWLGLSAFKRSIGTEEQYWRAAADKRWWVDREYWLPVVSTEGKKWVYVGKTEVEMERGTSTTSAKFHHDTMKLVQTEIQVPKIFSFAAKFGDDINDNRRKAARILYEAGVVRPLVDAARQKLAGETKWTREATAALAQVLRLESAAVYGRSAETLDPNVVLAYLLEDSGNLYDIYAKENRKELEEVRKRAYSPRPDGFDQPWPPEKVFSRHANVTAMTDKAVASFVEFWGGKHGISAGKEFDELKAALKGYRDVEASLLAIDDKYVDKPLLPDSLQEIEKVAGEWRAALAAVNASAGSVRGAVEAVKLGSRSLLEAYDAAVNEKAKRAEELHNLVSGAAAPAKATAPGAEEREDVAKAKARLTGMRDRVDASLKTFREGLTKSQDRQDFVTLDPQLLTSVEVKDADLRRKLEAEQARLFDLRRQMYVDANAVLATVVEAPGMEGLAPALAGVEEAVKKSGRAIDDLVAVKPGSYRFDEASAVSRFVSLRLAKRQRIYTLLRGVLDKAPKTPDEVGGKVTVAAKNEASLPRPVITGTNFKKDQVFDSRFHPKAATATFAGWKAIAGYVTPPSGGDATGLAADVINREELAKLYQSRQDAYTAYLKLYQDYWTKGVLGDLAYTCSSWKQFQQDLIGMQVRTVAENLEMLGQTILKSLNEVKGVVPADAQGAYQEAVGRFDKGARRFGAATYMGTWQNWLKKWKELGAEPTAARQIILPRTPADFIDDYIPFTADVDVDISERYWKELAYIGLEVLANEIDVDVMAAYENLKKWGRFPLAKPKAGEAELTTLEVAESRVALDKVLGVAQVFADSSIGAGKRTGKFSDIDKQLDRICGLGLPADKRGWCLKVKEVLAALPASNEAFDCMASIVAEKDQRILAEGAQSVLGMWTALRIDQGAAKKGSLNVTQEATKAVGKLAYPGDAVVIKFYRFPVDVTNDKVDRTKSITGAWVPVRLLHELKSTRLTGDGRKWQVELTIADSEARPRVIWLELEFRNPLPMLKDWP
jgi:hypothetical protein